MGPPNYAQFCEKNNSEKNNSKTGLSLRGGARVFPRILSQENRRKIETKEIPSCLISPLLVVLTPQFEILVTTPAFLCVLSFKNLVTFFLFFLSLFLLLTVIQVINLQSPSQTKIQLWQGHLKQTLFFSLLVLSFSLPMLFIAIQSPNRVHQHWGDEKRHNSVPTILTETATRCCQFQVFCIQFPRGRIFAYQLDAGDLRYFVSSFPDAEFLHLSLMQSILGILYPVSQMQNFCIVP